MRKITVLSMITLDGVMQAPGGREEDSSGVFEYGGWVPPYSDEKYNEVVKKELAPAEYLLGRKTFDIWENYWPKHAENWPGINDNNKYVISNTRNQTEWKNTIFIQNLADIRELKQSEGPDIQVWGSSQLIHLLLQHDLVDEIRLKIHPLLLGKGKKLFDDASMPVSFTLKDSIVTPKGVIIAHYVKVGKVKTGSFVD
jgi:dihydrofolate reductase